MARRAMPDLPALVLEACANATGSRSAVRCLIARPQDRGGCRLLAGEACLWWDEAVRPGLPEAAVREGVRGDAHGPSDSTMGDGGG